MNDGKAKEQKNGIELEFDLNEPPQKVWRASNQHSRISGKLVAERRISRSRPGTITSGQEVHYSLRDDAPSFFESTVTFTIVPNATGGTRLRIVPKLRHASYKGLREVHDNAAVFK